MATETKVISTATQMTKYTQAASIYEKKLPGISVVNTMTLGSTSTHSTRLKMNSYQP